MTQNTPADAPVPTAKADTGLSKEQMAELLKLANEEPLDRDLVVICAGYILGMAIMGSSDRLTWADREMLARASCYLKKSVRSQE